MFLEDLLDVSVKMIVDLLHQRPARLLLFGLDFYASNASGAAHGFRGYYVDEGRPEAGGGYHDSAEELRFLACLVRAAQDPIYMDGHLKRILEARAPDAAARLRRVTLGAHVGATGSGRDAGSGGSAVSGADPPALFTSWGGAGSVPILGSSLNS